ncbi:MAG: hypothetical protein VYC15_02515 [Pseudomonadota bacterium]|nr:hypothetical protein [Pseudomonadota bacterium]
MIVALENMVIRRQNQEKLANYQFIFTQGQFLGIIAAVTLQATDFLNQHLILVN